MDKKEKDCQMIESYQRGIKEKIEKVDNISHLKFIHMLIASLLY